MKTPEEIKKGFACTGQYSSYYCSICPYNNDGRPCLDNGREAKSDALEYIQQLEANWNQVSKALCGKENATLEELLQVVSQVKADLEAVKRERDALMVDILIFVGNENLCSICKHSAENNKAKRQYCKAVSCDDCRIYECACMDCSRHNCYEWRGVCPENTEVQE